MVKVCRGKTPDLKTGSGMSSATDQPADTDRSHSRVGVRTQKLYVQVQIQLVTKDGVNTSESILHVLLYNSHGRTVREDNM